MDSTFVNIWGLQVSYNVVFTVIASLTVGIILFTIKSVYEWNRKRIRLSRYRQYFEILIFRLQGTISRVSNNIRALNNQWRTYELKDSVLELSNELKLEQLKKIDTYDLFEIYLVKKYKNMIVNDFYIVLRNLEYIASSADNITQLYKYVIDKFTDYQNTYYSHLEQLRNYYDIIVKECTDRKDDKFLNDFHTHYTKLNKIDPKNIKDIQNNIIEPLKPICKTYAQQNDDRSLEMLYILQKIDQDINNLIHISNLGIEQIYRDILTIIKRYKEVKKKLKIEL